VKEYETKRGHLKVKKGTAENNVKLKERRQKKRRKRGKKNGQGESAGSSGNGKGRDRQTGARRDRVDTRGERRGIFPVLSKRGSKRRANHCYKSRNVPEGGTTEMVEGG